ncbi:MAG: ABC transporter ATP-binding protein [Cellvibrio sp. 79]|nr:MAG: ABC transporter ATP-binding protein [Cellvibrio sp. 79]
MNTEKLLEVVDVSKVFSTEEVETFAVNKVNFHINRGEYLAISGPSGGGKSTILSILGLLDSPTEGEYFFKGKETSKLSRDELSTIRNQEIGFIFQSFNLIENMSVLDNVMLPLIYRPGAKKSAVKARAIQCLEQVGMAHRKNHSPTQLSGGQQQRVAVARAMVTNPSIIFADEPTGNLDSKSAETVMDLIKQQHQNGATVCIVTHDPRYTQDATRTIHFADGSLVS